jgi:hypothetical protein
LAALIRIALLVLTLMLLGGGPAADAAVIDQFPLSIDSGPGALQQDGKLHPGAASQCSPPKTAPAVDPGTFNFNGFVEQSFINEPACLTIEYSTADPACQSDGLFSSTYDIDLFDGIDLQSGYLGDVGAAPINATPVSYSVPVAANAALQILFNMNVAGAGCSAFNVKVSSDRPWVLFKQPIAGHPFVGETLTSRRDRWAGAPAFTEQWRRCAPDGSGCVDIPGATAQTYVPIPDDVGHTLKVHVTATEAGMTSTADSDPVLIGVQFDAANGQSLSASDATQTGRLSRGFFASSCNQPPKQVPSLQNAAQTRFYDAFRHTNESGGTLCTMVSVDYGAFCTSNDRPWSAAYLPGFDPATSVRTNYLADSGLNGFQGERTVRYSFGVPAGSSYDVVVTTFTAGATCPGYDLRFGTASPYPIGAPAVEGTAQAGQTLTATDGSWTGAPSFAYQWQRCFGDGSGCGDIPGATGKTLALSAKDAGDSFRVRVTATEGLGSASKLSAVSAPVAEAPPVTPPPPPGPPAYAGIALKSVTKVVGKKGFVTLSLVCPAAAVGGCAGSDTLKLGKTTIGLKPFAMGPGKTAKVSFTLSKSIRKRLANRKKLNAAQLVNSFDVRGVAVRTTGKLTLKAKPRG